MLMETGGPEAAASFRPAKGKEYREHGNPERKERLSAIRERLLGYRKAAVVDQEHQVEYDTKIQKRRILVTQSIIGVNVLVYVVMILAGVPPLNPTSAQLIPWGSVHGPSIRGGEWWRIITLNFVHFGWIHLLSNMVPLAYGGRYAERLFGSFAFLFIYVMSGVSGGLLFVLSFPANSGAGASGAIFGVYGAMAGLVYVKKQAIPKSEWKKIWLTSIPIVVQGSIDSILPTPHGPAFHAGGLVMGFSIAACLPDPLQLRNSPSDLLHARLLLPVLSVLALAFGVGMRLNVLS